jgi:NTE family protein
MSESLQPSTHQSGATASGRPTPARRPRTVSLVLGSGGARGLAHIGVIQWLNENGYDIRAIAGCSMGALVGGIYAANRLDVYTAWVMGLERRHVLGLLDPTLGSPGLLKGDRVIAALRTLIGDWDIEALPLAYTAVATDLASGQEVWLRQGKLFDAIRASMATPLVFTPARHGQRLLIDGAVVNPVPVGPTANDGTDLTIAVDVAGKPEFPPPGAPQAEREADQAPKRRMLRFGTAAAPSPAPAKPPRGPLDVAYNAMQTMQDALSALKLAAHPPDVLIEVPRNACGVFEFWRAADQIALGRQRAAAALQG